MENEEALSKLKENLEKFTEDATQSGWEEDEVDEKVAEAFENFPWYKFSKTRKPLLSRIGTFCLYSLILYLAIGAVLQRNRRIKKNISDYVFDLQLPYYWNRMFRYVTLPIFKVYDLSQFHSSECLVGNPFLAKDILKCEFCENITSIPIVETNNIQILDIASNNEIVALFDVPRYSNYTIGFNDIRDLFTIHGKSMDESICKIFLSKEFTKISDFFRLSEVEVTSKNLSIGWRNCDAYGTRFYRKLFTRPTFISNMSEILLEKDMYFLQPGLTLSFERTAGETNYIFQVQGETEYIFLSPEGCHSDCTDIPLRVTLKVGQIIVYPNTDWIFSVKTIGEKLTILYLSAFDN